VRRRDQEAREPLTRAGGEDEASIRARPPRDAELDELRALLAAELGGFSRRLDRIDQRLRRIADATGVTLDPPPDPDEKRVELAKRTRIDR
jgi:hypothetical protein